MGQHIYCELLNVVSRARIEVLLCIEVFPDMYQEHLLTFNISVNALELINFTVCHTLVILTIICYSFCLERKYYIEEMWRPANFGLKLGPARNT